VKGRNITLPVFKRGGRWRPGCNMGEPTKKGKAENRGTRKEWKWAGIEKNEVRGARGEVDGSERGSK